MGLFDFVRDAGDKIFGGGKDEPEVQQRDLDDVLADKRTGEKLRDLVADMGFKVHDFNLRFSEGKATLEGKVVSQEEREKVVLVVGNTHGVAQVDDRLVLAEAPAGGAAPPTSSEATMYTVKSGDSLSKIAKAHYGDAMKYTAIFEANRPMLKDPNKIYPGQVLRIPPK